MLYSFYVVESQMHVRGCSTLESPLQLEVGGLRTLQSPQTSTTVYVYIVCTFIVQYMLVVDILPVYFTHIRGPSRVLIKGAPVSL